MDLPDDVQRQVFLVLVGEVHTSSPGAFAVGGGAGSRSQHVWSQPRLPVTGAYSTCLPAQRGPDGQNMADTISPAFEEECSFSTHRDGAGRSPAPSPTGGVVNSLLGGRGSIEGYVKRLFLGSLLGLVWNDQSIAPIRRGSSHKLSPGLGDAVGGVDLGP